MGGVSGLLGTISLLGLLLLIIGIALGVVAASQGRPIRGGAVLAVIGLVIWGFLSIVSQGILVVEPTQVAVITNTLSGQLEEPERGAGTTIIVPGVQVAQLYTVRQQEYTMSIAPSEGQQTGDDGVSATTSDGQQVKVDVTITYAVNPNEANTVHRLYGPNDTDWIRVFIRPTARTVVRDVIASLKAEDVYSTLRAQMQADMDTEMRAEMADKGFILDSFQVRGVTFSDEFAQAIDQKVIAGQKVQQAEQEAERLRTEALGEADANRLRAQGERDAAILAAEGQAQALDLVSQQIKDNPELIQYEYIRNLSDNVRLILVPSNSPFLFDFNQLTGGTTLTEEPTSEPTPGN